MERKMRGMEMLFLIALVAVFTNGIVLGSRSMDDREIKRQLKLLNKPAVKTIKVAIFFLVFRFTFIIGPFRLLGIEFIRILCNALLYK